MKPSEAFDQQDGGLRDNFYSLPRNRQQGDAEKEKKDSSDAEEFHIRFLKFLRRRQIVPFQPSGNAVPNPKSRPDRIIKRGRELFSETNSAIDIPYFEKSWKLSAHSNVLLIGFPKDLRVY